MHTRTTHAHRYWKSVAAAIVTTGLSLSLISTAFAQTETGNQAPTPGDDTASTTVDTAVQIDVLVNDSDPDGQGIFLAEWTQGANGSVEVNDAIVTYTQDEGFSGDDTFEYTVSDGDLTASATVTVTVEEAPAAPIEAVDDTASTTAGTAVEIDVLANDVRDEGVEITLDSVTEPANGTAEIVEGVVVYTPAEDFTGDDSFEYTITDGEHTDTGLVTVTVEAAPAPELDAIDDTATTAARTPVTIDVLANDTHGEGAEVTIESVTRPEHGRARIENGAVVYTPHPRFSGDDTFEYTITDGENTDTATVTVTVEERELPEGLDPDVVAACQAYDGDDSSIKLLCRVYLTGGLSPFVQQIIGSIILLTIPVPPVDPVIEACTASAGNPVVDTLCGLYQTEEIPDWLKESFGDLILRLTDDGQETPESAE